MINSARQQRLIDEAKALLKQGKVRWIIGFEAGSLKFTTTPLITADAGDTSRLVINSFIVNNLSNFLPELEGRIGIVAKGCDSRSIVSLIQDSKVRREDVVILAVPCSGLIDLAKVEQLIGKDRDEIDAISRKDDKVIVTLAGAKREFSISEALYDNCLACELPTPQEYDILLGEPILPSNEPAAGQKKLDELKKMSPEARWQFWKKELERCIRCYACRNACPACYCQRCFVEETEPQWLLPIPHWQDNLMFQITMDIHVAGRCTDCGECQRACPVNIPLRSLTKEMYDIVAGLFHFKAGMDKEALPLMTHYEQEEAEDLIR